MAASRSPVKTRAASLDALTARNVGEGRSTSPDGRLGAARRRRVIAIGLAAIIGMLAMAASASARIYWVSGSGGQLGRAELDGTGLNNNFITGTFSAAGVASSGPYIFWGNSGSNPTPGRIGRANADGTDVNQAFLFTASTCGVFTVAASTTHVYWGNSNCGGGGHIGRAGVDGSGSNAAIISTASTPCGLATDGNYLYWTRFNSRFIGRSALDGSAANDTWLDVGVGAVPCGLAVDDGYIYWTAELSNTARMDAIGRATIDGNAASINNNFVTGATFIANSSIPSSVAVDDSYLYWGDQIFQSANPPFPAINPAIGRANIDGTSPDDDWLPGPSFPMSIALDPPAAPDRTMTVSASGTGTGTVTGPSIDCGGAGHVDCTATVADGSTIPLTATPAAGSTFTTFSGGGCAAASPCNVVMNQDKAVDASFTLDPPQPPARTLSVTTSGTGAGTVTGPGIDCGGAGHVDCTESVADGSTIALTATPAAGSTFTTFSGGGCAAASPCTITMNQARSVDAAFTAPDPPPVVVGPAGPGKPASAPAVSGARSSNSSFAVGRASTPLQLRGDAGGVPLGTVLSYTLDQDASMTIAINRKKGGRLVKGACKKPTKKLRKKPKCDLTVATLYRAATTGQNEIPFTGRIKGKALKPGKYAAVFTGTGPEGKSEPVSAAFRIVKP